MIKKSHFRRSKLAFFRRSKVLRNWSGDRNWHFSEDRKFFKKMRSKSYRSNQQCCRARPSSTFRLPGPWSRCEPSKPCPWCWQRGIPTCVGTTSPKNLSQFDKSIIHISVLSHFCIFIFAKALDVACELVQLNHDN